MDKEFRGSVQNSEEAAARGGKNFPLTSSNADSPWALASRHGFSHLSQLQECLARGVRTTAPLRRLGRAIGFNQLEMLEAELHNQGILPAPFEAYRLSQIAAHEANIWRWRAERSGTAGHLLSFTINVPKYTLYRAEDLLPGLSHLETPRSSQNALRASGALAEGRDQLMMELRYLERLAAYLVGKFEHPSNRYQRGLNLVLQVVSAEKAEQNQLRLNAQGLLDLVLPLEKEEFFQALREHRSFNPVIE